jgi:hypothetical protein
MKNKGDALQLEIAAVLLVLYQNSLGLSSHHQAPEPAARTI